MKQRIISRAGMLLTLECGHVVHIRASPIQKSTFCPVCTAAALGIEEPVEVSHGE